MLPTVIPALSLSPCSRPRTWLLCYISQRSDVIVPWGQRCFCEKMCPLWNLEGIHYLRLLSRITRSRYWKQKTLRYYPHNAHSYYPNVSLCLCRASIVQKKVIYFQDEGSLTIRLCEKGNSSCPSSPHAFILDRSSWRHYPLFYLSFLLFKAEQLSVLSYCS